MATVSQFRNRGRSRSESAGEGPAFIDDLLAMVGSLANSRKEYAATQLESLAESVRQFSETVPAIPTMKAYAETAADSLEDLASYVVESDLADRFKVCVHTDQCSIVVVVQFVTTLHRRCTATEMSGRATRLKNSNVAMWLEALEENLPGSSAS